MSDPLKCTVEDLADDLPSVFVNAKVVGAGVRYEDYAKQEAVRGSAEYVMSRTDLCEFDTCPARWRNGYRDEATKATDWGTLMDCLVLSPDEFTERVAVCPKEYLDKGKKGKPKPWNFNARVCYEWRDEQEKDGKLIVKEKLAVAADTAYSILREHDDILFMLENSRKQVMVTAVYQDKETGIEVPVKCLIDLEPHGSYGFEKDEPSPFAKSLADFKTCTFAHPWAWEKHVHNFDLHTQGALYLDLFNAVTGEGRDEFRHIIQESYKPWQVAKRILSVEFISLGREKYRRILKRYAACLKSGHWADYDEGGPHDVVLDGWLVTAPADWMVLA